MGCFGFKMESAMNKLLIILSIIALLASQSFAWEPPEVIIKLMGVSPDTISFGRSFAWVGDQNRDGFDDLMISHYPNGRGQGINQVKFFFGEEEMDNEPDFIITGPDNEETFGIGLSYLGDLTGENSSWFVISTTIWEDRYTPIAFRQDLYHGGESLDSIPEMTMTRPLENLLHLGRETHKRLPCDFNGDGFDDIVLLNIASGGDYSEIEIFHGGEELDTIPDWQTSIEVQRGPYPGIWFSTGYDINNDGYDDLFVHRMTEGYDRYYDMFLGGAPMDTLPVFSFENSDIDSTRAIRNFSLLPDVNGDGYDDWGTCYLRPNDSDGFMLFYGSEDPDFDVDVWLNGSPGAAGFDGDITGGDFNGDGLAEIITFNRYGYHADAAMNIYFGRQEIQNRQDIIVNCVEQYDVEYFAFGKKTGATGDYNGDGVLDFIGYRLQGRYLDFLTIFSGSHAWLSVKEPTEIHQFELITNTYPNPFNSMTRISFGLPSDESVKIKIYDVMGRLVSTLVNTDMKAGYHTIPWMSTNNSGMMVASGIYFYRIEAGNFVKTQKMTLLK